MVVLCPDPLFWIDIPARLILNCVPQINIEALTPNVIVFGSGAFGR